MSARPDPHKSAKQSPASLFRERLRKLGQMDDARVRAHRILLALGWVIALAPNNTPAFTLNGTYRGRGVTLWLTDANRQGLPRSLTGTAWIGYYSVDANGDCEMLHDRDLARLVDFLHEHHADQLRAEAGAVH